MLTAWQEDQMPVQPRVHEDGALECHHGPADRILGRSTRALWVGHPHYPAAAMWFTRLRLPSLPVSLPTSQGVGLDRGTLMCSGKLLPRHFVGQP